jgi:cullin-associated NEDD8-dissociated protein 1
MATNDICTELQKETALDERILKNICGAILRQLNDKSNEVQSVAIKCLGYLVKRVSEAQVGECCNELCAKILEGNQELLDIYSIGLKKLISDVPETMGNVVADNVGPKMLKKGIAGSASNDVVLMGLEIMTDLLKRFGRNMNDDHAEILKAVMGQLMSEKQVTRKRAMMCLAAFTPFTNDSMLNTLAEDLLGKIESAAGSDINFLIQTISTISHTVGYRLGKHLDRMVPLFLKNCGDFDDEDMQTEAYDDLRESCLQALESFLLKCPREVEKHIPEILQKAIQFLQYDPNYSYGDDDDDEDMDGDDDDDDEYSGDDGDYSDDDDTSWKVRRSSIRVVSALIISQPKMLSKLYTACGMELIGRFKEREENVRVDIVTCFGELLKASVVDVSRAPSSSSSGDVDMTRSMPKLTRQRSSINILQDNLPALIKASNKILSDAKSSARTKSAVYVMLQQLTRVMPGQVGDSFDVVIPTVLSGMDDKNSAIKLDALVLMGNLFDTHEAKTFEAYMQEIIVRVHACVQEEWYKIIGEALRVVSKIATALHAIAGAEKSAEVRGQVKLIHDASLERLSAQDIDQDIKEKAIFSMGVILSIHGDILADELPKVLPMMLERLGNEITRMPALKTISMIAKSTLKLDMSSILVDTIKELSHFLRQQSRSLKQVTLETLDALITSNGQNISKDQFTMMLTETSALITDGDLHLSHLAVKLTISILAVSPSSPDTVKAAILPEIITLSKSFLLHGPALETVLTFYKDIMSLQVTGMAFEDLLRSLLSVESSAKQAMSNQSKCVAVLCGCAEEKQRRQTLTQLMDLVTNGNTDDHMKHLSLLCLGEVGKEVDLADQRDHIKDVVLESFRQGTEETKSAAAFAFGRMVVGNMVLLQDLTTELNANSSQQYLLLASLREVINTHASSKDLDFSGHVETVLPILKSLTSIEEEGVRNMVAECLGRLVLISPDAIFPLLEEGLTSDVPTTRWTSVTSLKYCLTGGNVDESILDGKMSAFIALLKDENLDVRRAALNMINSAAHHQGSLISHLVPEFFGLLCDIMQLQLKRVVDLGPFKHTVDDGLPLRKVAYSTVDTMLDTMTERVDVALFLEQLQSGLSDKEDIQLLCHQILIKLCAVQPVLILNAINPLLPPLEKGANKKVKDSQVGTEVDRANDLIRSTLRAIDALSTIPDAMGHQDLAALMGRLDKGEKTSRLLAQLRREKTGEHMPALRRTLSS